MHVTIQSSDKKSISREKYDETLRKLDKLEAANKTHQVQQLSKKEVKYYKRVAQGPTADYGGSSLDNEKARNELRLNQRKIIDELDGGLTPKQKEFMNSIHEGKGAKAMIGTSEDDIAAILDLIQLQSKFDQLKKDIERSIQALRALEGSPMPVDK